MLEEVGLFAQAQRGTAVLSPCGRYRYRLTRPAAESGSRVLFVMLNPSTADAVENDLTITKCTGFARRWGHGALEVVNLYAFRSTDPTALLSTPDVVGEGNDAHIVAAARRAGRIVAAWGDHGAGVRGEYVARLLAEHGDVWCLGTTKGGHPKHPSRIAYATPLVLFRARTGQRAG